MSGFIDSLRDEILRLESQLRHAKALLADYEGTAAIKSSPKVNGASRPRPFQAKGPDSKEHKVRTAIRDFLRKKNNGSAHRKEILEQVKTLGLMGHESDPLKALGVYLNQFKDEVSPEGKGVWGLKDKGQVASGFSAGDPVGA